MLSTGPVIVSYTQTRKLTVIYLLLIYDCTTFTSVKKFLTKILSELTVSKSLYILEWVLYLLLDIVVIIKTWFA